MRKLAFVFAGQGSQYSGMGKDFYDNFSLVKDIYSLANEVLGYNILDVSCGDLSILSETIYSQPAIFTLSMACVDILKYHGINPDYLAGFSLGEISAFCASQIVSREDGFKLVGKRAKAMHDAAKNSMGAMYAVLNVDSDFIENECNNEEGYAICANYNSPVQTVISGEEAALSNIAERLSKLKNAKVIRLNVSSAFHSKIMEPAAYKFYADIEDIEFNKEKIPLFSNVTGELLCTDDYRTYLRDQIISPVRWVDIVNNMINEGVDTFIELGPGKTLCGLIRKINKDAKCFNLENMETLNKLLKGLKNG